MMLASTLKETISLVSHVEPGLWIDADPQRFTQVLVNVLTNAIRYGGGTIRVDGHEEDGVVVLKVHDDGPGIARRFEETIWDRFERGAHRYDATTPGSGVGLPVARALVQAHDGKITQERSAASVAPVSSFRYLPRLNQQAPR